MADPQPDRLTAASHRGSEGLRHNRDFILLWSGQVVSAIGNRISMLGYPLLALSVTGSPVSAGLVGFALVVPIPLWSLPAGALVDRWNRKPVMIVAEVTRVLAVTSLVVALLVGRPALPQLAVVAFVEGTGAVFFQLAEAAALPDVVPRHQLTDALAQNQARDLGAGLAGQPLGGVLFGLGHLAPFLANAVSYLISLGSLMLIRLPRRQPPDPPAPPANLRVEMAEGIAWLARQRLMRTLAAVFTLANFAVGALPLILIVRAGQIGAAPAAIGLMMGLIGGGAVLGALIAPRIQRRIPERFILLGVLWTWTVLVAVLPALPTVLALGLVMALVTVLAPVVNMVVTSYRYALVPRRLLARVTGISRLITQGPAPLAPLAAGFILARYGPAPAFILVAAALGLVAVVATAVPMVRGAPSTHASAAASDGR